VNDRRQHGHPHGRRPSLRAELVRLGLRVAFKRQRAAKTVEEVRQRLAMFGHIVPPPPRDTKVSKLDLDGVPAVHVATPRSLDDRHLLYLHGGGHMSGSPGLYRDFTWRIADATRARVTILDHRLAPEHPFPAALDDAIAAYRRLLSDGADPRRMAFAGESSGGGLVFSTLLRLRDEGLPMPAAAVALSPWTDLALTGPSLQTNARADPMIRSEETPRLAAQYLAGADPRTPYASPLYGDHSDLPPTLIQVGSDEVLLDDSVRMAERLEAAGCHVEIEVWPRMPHAWQLWARIIPEANAAIARIGAFVQSKCPP
jgi:epsilon-lactone hydrolase